MPETGSERQQRSPAPEPGGSGAPPRCRLPLPAPCAAPAGTPARPASEPPRALGGHQGAALPSPARRPRSRTGRPGAHDARRAPKAPPPAARARRAGERGWQGLPGGAVGCSPRAGVRGLHRCADARCRLTPPWPQPRRAARAPFARTKFAARTLRPAAGAEQPRPPGPADVRRCGAVLGSARPAAGAAPGWGDLASLPALPRAPPSGPAEKLQLVEIFVLGVWLFYSYFLLFLNHRSSQKHDLRLLLCHQI